jgi:chemotaxis protein histidine kinase CheA
MSTISIEEQNKISAFLEGKHIPSGLGTEHEACSIAAINLALTGELTDTIPACMSKVIGKWIIKIQDAMPDEMRNSKEWRELLPLAAGTGQEHEKARIALIMDWVWSDVLPALQSTADAGGYGTEWKAMCTLKTYANANANAYAAAAYAAAAAKAYANAGAKAYYAADAADDADDADAAAYAAAKAEAAYAAAKAYANAANATKAYANADAAYAAAKAADAAKAANAKAYANADAAADAANAAKAYANADAAKAANAKAYANAANAAKAYANANADDAADAANAASNASKAASNAGISWQVLNPIKLLDKLIHLK